MKILGYIFGYDGCGYFRLQLPFKYLNMTDDCHAKIVYRFREEEIKWADLVVMQKPHMDHILPFVDYCKRIRKPVIIEFDDLIIDIPDWNLAREYYDNKKDKVLKFIEMAEACTVTTDYLKKLHLPHNQNIYVLPNSIDVHEFKRYQLGSNDDVLRSLVFVNPAGAKSKNKLQQVLPQKDMLAKIRGKTKIMWWGSPTHHQDTFIVEKTLSKLAREYPDLFIMVMGDVSDNWLKEFEANPNQLILVNPVQTNIFHKTLSYLANLGQTVVIAPIVNHPFNRCKSNLKVIEGMALRCPVVASNVENYSKTIIHGVNGMLANNYKDEAGIAPEWYAALKDILDKRFMADFMSENGYNTVTRDFNMSVNVTLWHDAYKNILENYK